MRHRINPNLVSTTSSSATKRRYAKKNANKRVVYIYTVFGKPKVITEAEAERLIKAGMEVEKAEI